MPVGKPDIQTPAVFRLDRDVSGYIGDGDEFLAAVGMAACRAEVPSLNPISAIALSTEEDVTPRT